MSFGKKMFMLLLLFVLVCVPLAMCAGHYDGQRYCDETYGVGTHQPGWSEVCVPVK